MNRTKAQKQEMVTALAAQLERSPTVYVTDFTGLDVARITDLRRRLRAAGVEYVVVKNTLARRALTDAQRAGLEPYLAGPTALVLGGGGPIPRAPLRCWRTSPGNSRSPPSRSGWWTARR